MTIAYLGLGGNDGDRLANLERAVSELKLGVTVTALSPLYETEPVGFANQEWFLNAAAAVETQLSPHELLSLLQTIERLLGKATPFLNGPRTLDLDLLLYSDQVINDELLIVPHPRLHRRAFVLRPLADVAGDTNHPTVGKTIHQLLNNLVAPAKVREWVEVSQVFPAHPAR